jgi:hypothetical protein
MEQEKIPHPFPLAPSTAKGIPRLRHGARWGSGVHLALCGRGALTSAFVGGGARRPGPETKRAGHLCDLPALGGPGQGQGYAGARVRVTFRWIGTAARSLDPILLHPGKELDTHIPGMSWKPRQKLCHIFTSIGVDGWNVLKPVTLPF